MKEFTEEQISNFADYEKVRKNGRYNMFDPRARYLTGLTPEDFVFVMNHYSALETEYKHRKQQGKL